MGGTTETNATYKTIIDKTEGGSITTYGVARPAVAVDNGGDVIIKGDGNDKTQEISVNGGTLYDGFKNTADTVKMVSPPWVLGVVGNSRATNMLMLLLMAYRNGLLPESVDNAPQLLAYTSAS